MSMKTAMKTMTLIISLLLPAVSVGATVVTKVTAAGINSNGNVFANMATTINQPGCPGVQVVLEPDNPYAKEFLSIAMTAFSTDTKVQIRTSGCYASAQPGFLPSAQDHGWIHLTK